MDITEEMLRAYVDGCSASGVADDEVDGLAVMRAGLRAVAPLIAAQALRQAAEEIRRELVCCDVYGTLGPELQARNLAGANEEVSDRNTGGHQICYWGEAAAVLVEPREHSRPADVIPVVPVVTFGEARERHEAKERSLCTRAVGKCPGCACVLPAGHEGDCDVHCGQRR